MDRVVPISEARARIGELIAESDDHPVYVMRHGRPAGVILSLTKFEGLIDRIEDLDDALSVANKGDAVPFTRTTN